MMVSYGDSKWERSDLQDTFEHILVHSFDMSAMH
jgi:hypothetical protein